MLTKFFDNTKTGSLANKFRRKRFRLFLGLISGMKKPVKILDAGGTESFWKMMGLTSQDEVNVIIANTEIIRTTLPNFKFIKCDARDLSVFRDKEFDIVFSNSVIEHVGDLNDQKKMAEEIIRVGIRYMVQTPNYYFPFEPHFMFPFFQYLPLSWKIFLVKNFSLGWFKKTGSETEAEKNVNSIKLLTKGDLIKLFPNGNLRKEKFLFFTKSFLVYK
jgi:hypothetical protein